jgi:sigma-B regulation protein RsbU (phosphoserine phosphatase)
LLDARLKAEAEVKAHSEAGLLREQFIAVLGHDLRNPLSAVAAGIELLEKHGHPGDVPVAIRKEMRASVDRAVALVNDILDLARSRLGNGLGVERCASAALTPVLEQVVAEARAIAPERMIETRFNIAEPVYCDRSRIAQLASNLVANALTHGAVDQPVRVDASTVGDRFLLSVVNAGPAISEEARPQLFQPFFRGGVRSSQNGLGLGLYIASEIAKAHEGVLDVRSTDEETCFTLSIPRTAEAAPSNQ